MFRRPTERNHMKRPVPNIAFALFLLFNLPTFAQAPNEDATAVRTTVTNYIQAYYTGDANRMEQTLHAHYLKHKIHGDIPVREQTGAQLVKDVRAGGGMRMPQAERKELVTVLDVAGNIASAKLVTPD